MNSYIDEHFIHRLNTNLDYLRTKYELSDSSENIIHTSDSNVSIGNIDNFEYYFSSDNSPVLSNRNSDIEDNDIEAEEDCIDSNEYIPKQYFHKLTLNNIKRSLEKYYDSEDKYSSELDILTSYLNGQKHLYSQAKRLLQFQLNFLMIPSLIGTGAITIFAPFITSYKWCGYLISAINAIVTILISIIHYFKFETNIENYLQLTSQYDRLENSLQMICSKMIFTEDSNEKNDIVINGLREFEVKMTELKDMDIYFLPNSIRSIFPIISHINIFSFIKRIETYKKNLMLKFKDVKNELRYILWKYGNEIRENPIHHMLKRIEYLNEHKNKLKEELLHYRTAYGYMDDIILREIKRSEKLPFLYYCYTCFTIKKKKYKYSNPVIDEYMDILFE